jgi:putative ABC transport system permease protein
MKTGAFAWRSLRREFRHGELATLAVALLLAVAALTAVGTLASRVEHTLLGSAADLMGGNLGISASRGALPEEFSAQAAGFGLTSSRSIEFASVLFADGRSQFTEIRAVDGDFPLRGELVVANAQGLQQRVGAPANGEVYIDHAVGATLQSGIGDVVQLGGRDYRIAGELIRAAGSAVVQFAPAMMMNLQDAQSSGLLGVGSRASYRLMLAGDADAIERFSNWAKPRLPDNARLTTIADAQANLRTTLKRGENFLRMAALLAVLLAGVAVALAAQRFARRKTEEVALLRCLGASRNEILLALLLELGMLALPAFAAGGAIGLGLHQAAFAFAGPMLGTAPAPIPFAPVFAAVAIGLAVLIGFALPPLLRLRDVEPMRVFRQDLQTRLRRFDVLYLLPLAVSAGLLMTQSNSLTLALVLACGLFAVGLLASLFTLLVLRLLRAVGRNWPGALRFGLANLGRRKRLTMIQVTALALSLTALDLLAVVGPSLLERWRAELPADTPNYFVLNLQSDQRAGFEDRLRTLGADNFSLLPLAAGKLVAINGKDPALHLGAGDEEASRRIEGEVRVSWSSTLPEANTLIEGTWFEDAPPAAQLSVSSNWMEMLKLKLGDTLTLRFGDQDLRAAISSVREVDWDSFRVNFFLMLDPAHGDPLPHSLISSFHLANGSSALAALSRDMPNLSLVDVNSILDRVRDVIQKVTTSVSWVLAFSLAAGVMVLLGALASTAEERRFETALLRTLGADRRQVNLAILGEFGALGLLAGAISGLGTAATSVVLASEVFNMQGFRPPAFGLAVVAVASAFLVMLAGLLGTRRIARTPPMLVLRRGN